MSAKVPASIRYKNPGAMWFRGNPHALKWGATHGITLNDGKGQGNNIAVFPTFVQGICAQLDLWRSSKRYKNKRFADAIFTWSGGNDVEAYIKFVFARVPGMQRDTIMNDAFWRSESGVAFLKAQAGHEAGRKYPAPDEDWIEAQRRVFAADVNFTGAEAPADKGVVGDPDIYSVQARLKAMNYNPGDLDGEWGGMTGGAISGFLNDRRASVAAPTSPKQFRAVLPDLRRELAAAEAKAFKRPVSEKRASGDAAIVAKTAPEVVPVRQGFLKAAWAAVVAFVGAFVDTVSGYVSEAWNFFTDHKDDVSGEGGLLSSAWTYVAAVPLPVWLCVIGGALAWIAFDAWRGMQKITSAVQSGERQ